MKSLERVSAQGAFSFLFCIFRVREKNMPFYEEKGIYCALSFTFVK